MYYPPLFPPEAQDRVEAAKVRAGREFDRNKQAAPSEREIRLSLVHYIMRVFGVFVREAKVRRLWHASEMKSACLEFLRQLTIEAESEKGYDHAGRPLSQMTNHIDGSMLPEILQAFKTWTAWRQFEAALLAVATSPAPRRLEAQPSPDPERPREIQPVVAVASRSDSEISSGRGSSKAKNFDSTSQAAGDRATSPRRTKRNDLRRYLDSANLTDKQYQCASLLWEYGLSITAIAKELSLHRTTVDQHISAAQAKMRSAGQYEAVRKKLAQHHPD